MSDVLICREVAKRLKALTIPASRLDVKVVRSLEIINMTALMTSTMAMRWLRSSGTVDLRSSVSGVEMRDPGAFAPRAKVICND
jgi:hypothetical protein